MAGEAGLGGGSLIGGGGGGAREESTFELENQRRRLGILQEYLPALVNDSPDLALEMASSQLDDDELLDSSLDMMDQSQMLQMRHYYEQMDDNLARGYWGQMSRGQQDALKRVGYVLPEERDSDDAFSFGHLAGDIISAPLKIASPVLKAVDWIGSQGSREGGRAYRTSELLEEEEGGGGGGLIDTVLDEVRPLLMSPALMGPLTFASGGIIDAVKEGRGSDIREAWFDAEVGEKTVRRDAEEQARELLGDENYNFALSVSTGKSAEEVVKDELGTLEGPEAVELHQKMIAATDDPHWQEALDVLRRGKISIGRSVSENMGYEPTEGMGRWVSGFMDGSIYLTTDPLNLVEPIGSARRFASRGLAETTLRNPHLLTDRVAQIEAGPAGEAWHALGRDVRRAFDPADAGMDFAQLQRKHKHLISGLSNMAEWHADDIRNGGKGFLTDEVLDDLGKPLLHADGTPMVTKASGWKNYWETAGAWQVLIESRLGGNKPGHLLMPIYSRRQMVTGVGKKFFQTGLGSLATGERGLDLVANHANEVGKTAFRWRAAGAPSRVIQSFVKQQPFVERAGKQVFDLTKPESVLEFRKWVDGLSFANLNRGQRDTAINAFVTANPAGRRKIIYDTYRDALHRSGLLEDVGAREVLDDQLLGIRQAYGIDEDGNAIQTALAIDSQSANALQLPAFQDFLQSTKKMSITRSVLQGSTMNRTNQLINRYWKPAVVARPGFAARAVADELLMFVARHGPGAYLRSRILEQNWAKRGDLKALANSRKGYDDVLAARMGLGDRNKFWAAVEKNELPDDLFELQLMRPVLWASQGMSNMGAAKAGGHLFGYANRKLVDLSLGAGGFFHHIAEMSKLPTKAQLAEILTSTYVREQVDGAWKMTRRMGNSKRLMEMAERHPWWEQALAEDVVGGGHASGVEQALTPSGRTKVLEMMDHKGEKIRIELSSDPSMYSITSKAGKDTKELHEVGYDVDSHMTGASVNAEQVYNDRAGMAAVGQVLARNVSDAMADELLSVPHIREALLYDEEVKRLDDLNMAATTARTRLPGHAEDVLRMTDDPTEQSLLLAERGFTPEEIADVQGYHGLTAGLEDDFGHDELAWSTMQDRPVATGEIDATRVVGKAKELYNHLPSKDKMLLRAHYRGWQTDDGDILKKLSNQGKRWAETWAADGGVSSRVRALLVNDIPGELTAKSMEDLLPDVVDAMMYRVAKPDVQMDLSKYDRAQRIPGGAPVAKPLSKDHAVVYAPLFDFGVAQARWTGMDPQLVEDTLLRHLAQVDYHGDPAVLLAEVRNNIGLAISDPASPLYGIAYANDGGVVWPHLADARAVRTGVDQPLMPFNDWVTANDQIAEAVGRTLAELSGTKYVLGRSVVPRSVVQQSARIHYETKGLIASGNFDTWEDAVHFTAAPNYVAGLEEMPDVGRFVDVPQEHRVQLPDTFHGDQLEAIHWRPTDRDDDQIHALQAHLEAGGLTKPITDPSVPVTPGLIQEHLNDTEMFLDRQEVLLNSPFPENLNDEERAELDRIIADRGQSNNKADFDIGDWAALITDLAYERSYAGRAYQQALDRVTILDDSIRSGDWESIRRTEAARGKELPELPVSVRDGLTQSEVMRPAMEAWGSEIMRRTTSGTDNPQVLHELIEPMMRKDFQPIDMAKVPYEDLPKQSITPNHVVAADLGGWDGIVRKFFNGAITPFINAYMRTPQAWYYAGEALPIVEGYADAYLVDWAAKGDFDELVTGYRAPVNRVYESPNLRRQEETQTIHASFGGEDAVNMTGRNDIRFHPAQVEQSWTELQAGEPHGYFEYMNLDSAKVVKAFEDRGGISAYKQWILKHEEGHNQLIRLEKEPVSLSSMNDMDMSHEAAASLRAFQEMGMDPTELVKDGMDLNAGLFGHKLFEPQFPNSLAGLHGINGDTLRDAWRNLPDHLKSHNANPAEVAEALGLPGQLGADQIKIIRRHTDNFDHTERYKMQMVLKRAHSQVIQYMDDSRLRSYAQEYLDGLVPFLFAEEQFLKRLVRSLAMNPDAIRKGELAMMGMQETGVVKDDGFGNQVVVYPGGAALQATVGRAAAFFGMDFQQIIPLKLTGTVQNFSPGFDNLVAGRWGVGFSPLVGVGLNGLSHFFPEMREVETGVLGQQAQRDSVSEYFMPSWAVRLKKAFTGDEDGKDMHSAFMQAAAYLDYADPDGSKGMGMPDEPTPQDIRAFHKRAADAARVLSITRAVFTPFAPAAPQWTDPQDMKDAAHTAEWDPDYLEYIQAYGIEEGLPMYLEHHREKTKSEEFPDGRDATPFTVFTTKRESGAPIAQTQEAFDFVGDNKDYMESFRYAAPWLIPTSTASDKFERKAYQQQLELGLRERKTPDEWIEDLVFAQSAPEYFDMKDAFDQQIEGLESGTPEKLAAEDTWIAWQESFLRRNPLFKEQLGSTEARARREMVLNEMWYVANDDQAPDSGSLPAIRELIHSYRYMSNVRNALRNDRRATAKQRKEEILTHFIDWAERYLPDHPEVVSFYNSVIRPQLGSDVEPFTGSRVA